MPSSCKKIIIIGCSIFAEIIHEIVEQDARYEIIGFAVNKAYHSSNELLNKPVYCLEDIDKEASNFSLINGIGYGNVNKNRELVFESLKKQGYSFEPYIHPNAVVLTSSISEGVFVMPGAILEPFSKVYSNSVVWSNAVIGHHASIGKNCWIAAGVVVAGESIISDNTFLGVNSTITNKVTVEQSNIIGASTLVSKSTTSDSVFLGRNGEKHRFDSDNYAKFFNK